MELNVVCHTTGQKLSQFTIPKGIKEMNVYVDGGNLDGSSQYSQP